VAAHALAQRAQGRLLERRDGAHGLERAVGLAERAPRERLLADQARVGQLAGLEREDLDPLEQRASFATRDRDTAIA
jgi:hypothetical protein